MITSENITYYFDNLSEVQINETFSGSGDNIAACFGSYGYPYLDLITSENEIEMRENAESTGGFICDKDDFLRLFQESESLNPWLIDLL